MHPLPTEAPVYKTEWLPDESLIITELKGPVDVAAIEAWELSLRGTLDQLPDNTAFKILVDLVGLAPVDVETHKRYRSIVPAPGPSRLRKSRPAGCRGFLSRGSAQPSVVKLHLLFVRLAGCVKPVELGFGQRVAEA